MRLLILGLLILLIHGSAPSPPKEVSVELLRNRYALSWLPVSNATSYRVYISNGIPDTEPDSAESARSTGVLRQPGIYEFSVTAVDSEGRESRPSRGVKAIRFDRPWGIALARDGRRIVRDAHLDKQAVLDSANRALALAGPDGYSHKGSYDVAVDPAGRILTAKWGDSDRFGFVIQNSRFGVVREYLRPAGSSPGEFRQPMGIGVDSRGSIFVADTGNNRVQQFTRDGKFTRMIGTGELRLPMKVAFGAGDTLYVADSGNNRIAVYERDSARGYALERSITGMKEPVYVAVDKDANVFVSANRVAGVHMYGPDGKERWKYEGDSAARLSGPRGLAVDGRGNLLIVDEASLRILTVKIPASRQ